MGSTRLPGKVLSDIAGKPALLWLVERIQRARVDDIVVATTVSSVDDPIVEFCNSNHIKYFRGSENDVLGRVASLLRSYPDSLHLEFFGDSPFVDPNIIDSAISFYFDNSSLYKYVSSALSTTYPPGMEVSLYNANSLIEVDKLISADDPLREHCGYNLTRYPQAFPSHCLKAPPEYNFPDIYLELDYQEDLDFLRHVIAGVKNSKSDLFTLADILDFLSDKPWLTTFNQTVERRWKHLRLK